MIYRGIANKFVIVKPTNDDINQLFDLLMDKTPVYVYFLVDTRIAYNDFIRVMSAISAYQYRARHTIDFKTRISIHVMVAETRRSCSRQNTALKRMRAICDSMIGPYHIESSQCFSIGHIRPAGRCAGIGNTFSCAVDHFNRIHVRINGIRIKDVNCHEADNSSKK